jgi:hypothetical protein
VKYDQRMKNYNTTLHSQSSFTTFQARNNSWSYFRNCFHRSDNILIDFFTQREEVTLC